jgi:hypothetical protein
MLLIFFSFLPRDIIVICCSFRELPENPFGASLLDDEESWLTFEHEGGMATVTMLAEAKHREDFAVQDFTAKHPSLLAKSVS